MRPMKCVRTQSSSAVVSGVPTGRREMDSAVDASDVGPGDAHGFLAHESSVDRDDPLAEPTTEAGAVRRRPAEDGADDGVVVVRQLEVVDVAGQSAVDGR